MKRKQYGKCALCGKECELTFEHIPPRAAFNSHPARPVSGDRIVRDNDRMPWDMSGLPYENQQRGMGRYSLCPECNNNTGTWYGDAYAYFTHVAHEIVQNSDHTDCNGVRINKIYPLRIVKQVISMFCSINNFNDGRSNTLRQFVLDKNKTGLDPSKYRLCMYFTKGNLMKYIPLSAVLSTQDNKITHHLVSEITAYPLGFVLYFNPPEILKNSLIDITSLSNCPYDSIIDLEMPLIIKEVNDLFPTFYRSKEDIVQCVDDNKKWIKEHEKLDGV